MKNKKSEEFEKKKKQFLSITQILILLIGILAFSYIVGEIGKQQGIEVSRGIGVVGAQVKGENCIDDSCSDPYICNLNNKKCDDREEVCFEQGGEKRCTEIPKSEADKGEKGIGDYINEFGGYAGAFTAIWQAGKLISGGGGAGAGATPGPWAEGYVFPEGTGGGGSGETVAKGSKFISFAGKGANYFADIFGSALAAAGTAYLVWQVFKAAGASEQNLNMIANAGIVGAIGGFGVSFLAMESAGTFLSIAGATGPVGWVAALATLVFMAIMIVIGWTEYILEIVDYQVNAWQAQTGGANCEKCNKNEFGCTEYQCKTYGQGCGIINPGTTQERCVWEHPDDREYPVITENATLSQFPEGYYYEKATAISPPDTGVEITSTSKNCIPPFSNLILGVTTDEPAHCRISTNRTREFKDMVKDMDEGSLKIEEHTKIIPNSATPNNWALNNLVDTSALPEDIEFEITKGNEYEYYIKCQDTNENENPANFVIKFCVQDKDLTAPIINGFFPGDNSYLQFNTPNVEAKVYTNEPAECKWDFNDKNYNDLEHGMTCDTTINQASFLGNKCIGNFTGLKNGEENKYYIRCQDRSEDKNTNSVSKVYALKVSSQTILIDSIKVNGKGNNSIIKDARDVIPVDLEIKTSFGAQNGKAKCSYKYLGNQIPMSFDYKEVNTQTLWLPEGEHELPISCEDIAGDTDTGSISFTLIKDRESPIVARAYYDVNNLKVITNEPAECVYTTQSNIGCAYEFKDGTAMSEIGELTHYTSWQAGKKYFIKCKDAFGNQPLPGQCGIIVKAFESY